MDFRLELDFPARFADNSTNSSTKRGRSNEAVQFWGGFSRFAGPQSDFILQYTINLTSIFL